MLALALNLLAFSAAPTSAPRPEAGGPRNLVVYFEFLDNGNGVEEAVTFLFERMLGPDDRLIIQSPARAYSFSRDTLSRPKAELIALMREKLRGDIARAAQSYKQIIGDLDAAAREIEELAYPTGALDTTKDMNELFILYRQALANLNQLRKINAASLRRLAGAFRGHKGENHIIILFEREFRPIPRREALNVLADTPRFAIPVQRAVRHRQHEGDFRRRRPGQRLQQVPLAQHFIYITSKHTSVHRQPVRELGRRLCRFQQDRLRHRRRLPNDQRTRVRAGGHLRVLGRRQGKGNRLEAGRARKRC